MHILLALFALWLVLGALKRRPVPTPVLTIRIIERRDDGDRGLPEGPVIPRPEPEVERANRRRRERERAQ